jgi:hypothetical protein
MMREIFNSCSNNQMRDVFFTEVEVTDGDFDALVAPFLIGGDVTVERVDGDGEVVFDIVADGMRQRISFC